MDALIRDEVLALSAIEFFLWLLTLFYYVEQGDKVRNTSVEGGITEQLLRPSALTSVTDHAAAMSHLRAIAAAKRKNQPSLRWYVHLSL